MQELKSRLLSKQVSFAVLIPLAVYQHEWSEVLKMNICLAHNFVKVIAVVCAIVFIFLVCNIRYNIPYIGYSTKPPALSSDGQYNIETTETSKSDDVKKILIITQARSGSSFLGSIMSASSSAYYVYEPFKRKKINGTLLDEYIDNKEWVKVKNN